MHNLVWLLFALALGGCCVYSSKMVDVDGPDPPWVHRVWVEDKTVVIVVDGKSLGLAMGVAVINYHQEGDAIYLREIMTSIGYEGLMTFRVDLSSLALTDGWEDRVYWGGYGTHYSIGQKAFWQPQLREPRRRVKVKMGPQ